MESEPDTPPIGERHLLLAGLDRRTSDRIAARIIAEHDGPTAYINVAGAPTMNLHTTFTIGRDDLDGAIGLLDALGRLPNPLLYIDGLAYWLRGPDTPFDNPGNNPRIAAWNARLRESNTKRIRFRNRLQTLAGHATVIARTPDPDKTRGLLGQWPCGLSETGCDWIQTAPGRHLTIRRNGRPAQVWNGPEADA